jgi:prevent-host-death family protein
MDGLEKFSKSRLSEQPMRREVTAMCVRQNLGEYLSQVQYRGDSVVVTKDGKPVAAIVDYPLYERMRALRTLFDELSERLGSTYAGVPEAEAQAEIDEAVRSVRRRKRD